MKKIWLTAATIMIIAGSALADGGITKNKNVSYKAQQSFPYDFQNAQQVSWSVVDDYSKASFIQNDVTMSAYYDWEGKLAGTTQHVAYAGLPASAQKSIEKYYKDYLVQNVILYNDNEDNQNDLYPLIPEESNINYFVFMKKNTTDKEVVLQVAPNGQTSFFENIR